LIVFGSEYLLNIAMEKAVDRVPTYDDVFSSNGHDNHHSRNDTYEDIDDVIARMGPLSTDDQHIYENLEHMYDDGQLASLTPHNEPAVNKLVGSQPKSRQDTYAKYIKSTLGDANNNNNNISRTTSLDLDVKKEKRLPVDGKHKHSIDVWPSTTSRDVNSKQSVTQAASTPDDAEVDKMTTCPICSQMFSNPKMLPCLHTFCLSCLEQSMPPSSSDGNADGELVVCPLCQISFQIPPGGLSVLPTNSLFARITGVRRTVSQDSSQSQPVTVQSMPATPEDMFCTLCAEGGACSSPPQAVYTCIDCNDDLLCTDCAAAHRKQRMSKSHRLVPVDPGLDSSPMCPLHESHAIESYCVNCLSPVCKLCRELPPRSGLADLKPGCRHSECVSVATMAQSSRKQLEEDVDQIKQMANTVQGLVTSITLQRQTFLGQINEVEKEINETAVAAASNVEKNRQQLIDESNALRTNTVRELDKVSVEMLVGTYALSDEISSCCRTTVHARANYYNSSVRWCIVLILN